MIKDADEGFGGHITPDQEDFYFWLGAEGVAEEVSEAEFEGRQDLLRANLENWINVRINPTKGKNS